MTEQITEYEFSWEITVAIIGALAWLPWLFEIIKKPKLYGTIISYLENQGQFNTRKGTLHFLKLSISCINKNFNVNDFSVKVKYQNNDVWYTGHIFWARTSTWAMNPVGTVKKKLNIPNQEFLGFVNMFEKDKSLFYYLTFIVEKQHLEEFETIKMSFKNPQGREKVIVFNQTTINPDRVLFDDGIWT